MLNMNTSVCLANECIFLSVLAISVNIKETLQKIMFVTPTKENKTFNIVTKFDGKTSEDKNYVSIKLIKSKVYFDHSLLIKKITT